MPVPSNDLCSGAIPFTSLPFSVTQDTRGATDDAATPDSSCASGNSYNGVWYKWLVPPNYTRLSISVTDPIHGTYHVVTAFFGSCGALTQIDCASYGGIATLTGLVPGDTIYFLITSIAAGGAENVKLAITHPQSTGMFCFLVGNVFIPREGPCSKHNHAGIY